MNPIENNKIQIRAFFGEWRTVDKETAAYFVRQMLSNMPNISDKKERIKRIEAKHLRGATVSEMLGESLCT